MPRRPELASDLNEVDDTPVAEDEARAARKAAKRAAKKAAQASGDLEAGQDGETPKRKAKDQEGKESEDDTEARAARKAAKRAARRAAQEGVAAEVAQDSVTPKRKKRDEAERDSEASAKKKLKSTDGEAVVGAEAFRKAHQIVVDESCPAPMETFNALKREGGAPLVKALTQCGYTAPTPIQAQAWPIALLGKDLVAVAKTGSGKTCGFLLPVLARIGERGPKPLPEGYWDMKPAHPSTLVLAPTRELIQQIAVEAEKFAPVVRASVVVIYGGTPRGDQIRKLKSGCDVLLATPGRLLDFTRADEAKNIRQNVFLESVSYLVLDEADRMLDMGFEQDIRTIVGMCPATGTPEEGGGATGARAGTKRQTLFFTATWPRDVQKTATSLTSQEAVQVRIGQGSDGDELTVNADIRQTVMVIQESEKFQKLKEVLASELHPGETCMIFVGQKARCDELTGQLRKADLGLWANTIHSGRDQTDRERALATFRSLTANASNGGKRGVLVATDVASRGIDIPGVALVVVYDFGRALHSAVNGGVEAYVHRIGRTGRAGKPGRAITFYTSEDLGAQELIPMLRTAGQEVPAELEDLAYNESWGRHKRDSKAAFYSGKGKGRGKGKGKGKGLGRGTGKGGLGRGGRGWGGP